MVKSKYIINKFELEFIKSSDEYKNGDITDSGIELACDVVE